MIRVLAFGIVLGLAFGCAGVLPPTYTQAELAQECQRTGGWWHPDSIMAGNCEYQNQGFQ